jgi:AcrR family transcriptional regulator
MPEKPQRADARRNRERVLRAAQDAFALLGTDVSLDEIAARAGVGPGTVHRHFPTKEALLHAVAAARISALTDQAKALAEQPDPGAAFFTFLARASAEGAAKRDLPSAVALADRDVDELHAALGGLLERAQDAGAVRTDFDLGDLVALLKTMLRGVQDNPDPRFAERLLLVLSDGLRPPRG